MGFVRNANRWKFVAGGAFVIACLLFVATRKWWNRDSQTAYQWRMRVETTEYFRVHFTGEWGIARENLRIPSTYHVPADSPAGHQIKDLLASAEEIIAGGGHAVEGKRRPIADGYIDFYAVDGTPIDDTQVGLHFQGRQVYFEDALYEGTEAFRDQAIAAFVKVHATCALSR